MNQMGDYFIPDTCKGCGEEIDPDDDSYVLVGVFPSSPSGHAWPTKPQWFCYHGLCYPVALTAEIASLRLRY